MFRWIDAQALEPPELLELLGDQREALPVNKQIPRALLFVPSLANLGLRRAGEPPDVDFLAASAGPLRGVWDGVVDIRDSASRLVRDSGDAETWRQAVEQRTSLQFIADWYYGPLADLLPTLRLSDLDAELRQRAETETLVADDVPPGVPASHWWWRVPC